MIVARRFIAVLVGIACILGGIIVVGKLARDYLDARQHRDVLFYEIQCEVPSGLDRLGFLHEVRNSSGFADVVPIPDPELTEKLSTAFLKHPSVESVTKVESNARIGIRVELVLRKPVLGVEIESSGKLFVIDHESRLLPHHTANLLRFTAPIEAPTVGVGEVWDDPTIKAAVRVATVLAPEQERFRFRVLEVTPFGWRLRGENGQSVVLWGRAPGDEQGDEPPASKKIEKLREALPKSGHLTNDLDLRKF